MRSSSLWLFTFSITILFALCQSTYKERSSSCDSSNCVLPLCKCPNKESPEGVSLADIPMMVGISFNGVIPSRSMKYFKKILNPIFKNPNGCPTQATFFVSDKMDRKETDYCVVQNLFNNNNEIAVGSVKYKYFFFQNIFQFQILSQFFSSQKMSLYKMWTTRQILEVKRRW